MTRADRLVTFIATFGGAGYAPFVPGTAGSLAALPLAWVAGHHWGIALVLAAITVAIGVPAAGRVATLRRDPDPGVVVIDEVAGMMFAVIGVGTSWFALGAAFVWFRIFDVLKPPPCRRLEKLHGGWGIVLDDLAAGIYACLATHGTLILLGSTHGGLT